MIVLCINDILYDEIKYDYDYRIKYYTMSEKGATLVCL